MRHFITGEELSADELDALLDRAIAMKADPLAARPLEGRTVALIFEKPSTRTRTSFEAGVFELGGHPMVLRAEEMQITRGESMGDVARVLSRHAAVIGLRTGSDAALDELAEHATVPVVNMLSPSHHPCQALADLMTMREALGDLRGRRLAFVGDGANNVARSLAVVGGARGSGGRHRRPGAVPAGGRPRRAAATRSRRPPSRAPTPSTPTSSSPCPTTRRPRMAAAGTSTPFRLDDALLDRAAPGAFALHCLPAHPGEEITAEVLYGGRQRIWDQAENRRHAQKALIELLLAG